MVVRRALRVCLGACGLGCGSCILLFVVVDVVMVIVVVEDFLGEVFDCDFDVENLH
jgi:hypothetical protein